MTKIRNIFIDKKHSILVVTILLKFFCFHFTDQVIATHQFLHPFKYRQRFSQRVSCSAYVRQFATSVPVAHSHTEPATPCSFQFKRALIVTKLSRFEFEQHKNPKLTLKELEKVLRDRGTDYDMLLHYHKIHKDFEACVADSFKQFDVDVKLVNRLVASQ